MKIDDLFGRPGEWLKGTGPDSDVVVSSRVRLARNLTRFPFLTVASPSVRAEIEKYVRSRLESPRLPRKLAYWSLEGMKPLDRTILVERHLISREHAQSEGDRGVAVGPDETISIMVNEEDHLRMQAIRSGFQLEEAYEEVNTMDSALEGTLQFSFNVRFGYLTACPTNAGTGLRLSVMTHLPAVSLAKQMEKVLQSLQRVGYTVRGFYGEGTSPVGDFYQVSNQVTLGKSESEMVSQMKLVVPKILDLERHWRGELLKRDPRRLEDRVWRAYAILKNARRISSEEATDLISALRLGVCLKMLKGITNSLVNDLAISIQPGHLQKLEGRALDADERDSVRADLLRSRLEGA